LRGFLLTFLMA